jgi:hypothetical protein
MKRPADLFHSKYIGNIIDQKRHKRHDQVGGIVLNTVLNGGDKNGL